MRVPVIDLGLVNPMLEIASVVRKSCPGDVQKHNCKLVVLSKPTWSWEVRGLVFAGSRGDEVSSGRPLVPRNGYCRSSLLENFCSSTLSVTLSFAF